MPDRITANLPSRDIAATVAFYATLGFEVNYQSDAWLILSRGDLELEFFSHPTLDPPRSWFSACLRLDDIDALHTEWRKVGLPMDNASIPRLTDIFKQPDAPRMFALVDADGSLLRVLDNGG